jgi:hypothetical protein
MPAAVLWYIFSDYLPLHRKKKNSIGYDSSVDAVAHDRGTDDGERKTQEELLRNADFQLKEYNDCFNSNLKAV